MHRRCLEARPQFNTFDQIDPSNSSGCEFLFRAAIATEKAVRLNSSCPDYIGVENLLIVMIARAGGIVTMEYIKFVASLQQAKAKAMNRACGQPMLAVDQ